MEVYHSEIKMISVFTPPTRTLLTLPTSCPSRIYLFIYREISRDTQTQGNVKIVTFIYANILK